MSVSLKELCQMVNVPYDQARALIESESSDGESVEREEATVVEDTVVHAGRVNFWEIIMISHAKMDEFYADGFHNNRHLLKKIFTLIVPCVWKDFSGGLEGEEASLLAPEQVQFDTGRLDDFLQFLIKLDKVLQW